MVDGGDEAGADAHAGFEGALEVLVEDDSLSYSGNEHNLRRRLNPVRDRENMGRTYDDNREPLDRTWVLRESLLRLILHDIVSPSVSYSPHAAL